MSLNPNWATQVNNITIPAAVSFMSSNDPLEVECMAKKFLNTKCLEVTFSFSIRNPHLIYDSQWWIPAKRLLKRENMQNYATYGVSGDGFQQIFSFPSQKRRNRKIIRIETFLLSFFSGSSNLINSSLQWDFRHPWFIFSVCLHSCDGEKHKKCFL